MGWCRNSAINLMIWIIRDCMCAQIQIGGHCSGTDSAYGTAIQLECIPANADTIVVPVSGQQCVTEIQCVGTTQTGQGCLTRRISYLQFQFRRTVYRYIAIKANRHRDVLSGRISLVGRGSRIDRDGRYCAHRLGHCKCKVQRVGIAVIVDRSESIGCRRIRNRRSACNCSSGRIQNQSSRKRRRHRVDNR